MWNTAELSFKLQMWFQSAGEDETTINHTPLCYQKEGAVFVSPNIKQKVTFSYKRSEKDQESYKRRELRTGGAVCPRRVTQYGRPRRSCLRSPLKQKHNDDLISIRPMSCGTVIFRCGPVAFSRSFFMIQNSLKGRNGTRKTHLVLLSWGGKQGG